MPSGCGGVPEPLSAALSTATPMAVDKSPAIKLSISGELCKINWRLTTVLAVIRFGIKVKESKL
jgi:hypothetical protein